MKAFAPAAAVLLCVVAFAGCLEEGGTSHRPVGRLDGAVVDQLLNPWADTVVHLVGHDRRDTTNGLGGFTFRGLPVGVYTVQVRMDGGVAAEADVAVPADGVGRVILQVPRDAEPYPYVAKLRHEGRVELGLPGQACGACSWSTPVHDPWPDYVYLQATWSGGPTDHAGKTRLHVELRDDAGRVVTEMEGMSPLTRFMHGSSIPADTTKVEVRVTFHAENELPHPGFRMESMLCLYYDLDTEHPDGC